MSVFINLGGDGTSINGDRRQLIRSQAMKAFRRQQRETARQKHRQAGQTEPHHRNGSAHQKHIDVDNRSSSILDLHNVGSQAAYVPGKDGNTPSSVLMLHQKMYQPSRVMRFESSYPLFDPSSAGASSHANNVSELQIAQAIRDPLRSPAAYRQQLILPFLDVHLPRDTPNLHLIRDKVNAWLRPSHGASMVVASNAVLLHALAFAQGDESLMWTAMCENNEAVKRLRKLLRDPDGLRNEEAVLVTDALALFDTSSEAWPSHARGLTALIAARTPDYWTTRAPLLHDLVFQLLMHALLTRKPFVLGEAPWLSAMSPTCKTRLHRLIFLGCHIPGILVRCDRLLDPCQPSSEDPASLWQSIIMLERSLHGWFSDWYRAKFQNRPPYGLNTNIRSLKLGEQVVVELSPLKESYTFPSLVEAIGHNCFWTLLLIVCEARYDLLSSSSSRAEIVVPQVAATLVESVAKNSATQCADAICRTAPFIMQSVANVPNGLASSAAPLTLAAKWYKKCGKLELASWCDRTVEILTDKNTQYPGWITRSCAAWVTAAL